MPPAIHDLDFRRASENELRTAYAIRLACHTEAAPDEPPVGYPDWLALNLISPAHVHSWHWITDGGYARLVRIEDSPSGIVEICVAASARRRG